jgi:hypothetical protein
MYSSDGVPKVLLKKLSLHALLAAKSTSGNIPTRVEVGT